MSTDIDKFYNWYNEYFESFRNDDIVIKTNIQSKKEHTLRVCENIIDIGRSLDLNERDLFLAEATGLFHDLGRFEQFTRYKTFRDAVSEDHGALSSNVLIKSGILENLPTQEKDIIIKAVNYHNKYKIPDQETEEVLFFSRLIRDADKLDIYELLISYYEESHKYENNAFEDYPDSTSYDPVFVDAILYNTGVNYELVKTTTDIKLMRLSWIYDINFKRSYEIIRERRYMERILKVLPDIKEKAEIYEHIVKYMDGKIKG